MRIGDLSRAYGVAASVVLHGLVIAALTLAYSDGDGASSEAPHSSGVVGVTIVSSPPTRNIASSGADAGIQTAVGNGKAVTSRGSPGPLLVPGQAKAKASIVGAGPIGPYEPSPVLEPVVNDGRLRSNYQAALFAHVLRYRYYPEAARADRQQGVVRVQFAITRNGRVITAWVERSSGHPLLDEAALDAIRRAQPFPAIPSELPDEMEVLLPLDYLPPKVILAG